MQQLLRRVSLSLWSPPYCLSIHVFQMLSFKVSWLCAEMVTGFGYMCFFLASLFLWQLLFMELKDTQRLCHIADLFASTAADCSPLMVPQV